MVKTVSIHIIALGALGGGLSGGDRIFIEFARHWSKKKLVNLYVWEEGLSMCRREKLDGKFLKINLIKVGKLSKFGFIFTYFYRIFLGLKLGLMLKTAEGDFIYSASEFWMDSLPAFILKQRNKLTINWVAAWFQTAPSPLKGFSEGRREKAYKLNAFWYWIMQKPIKSIISSFADFVLVNNDSEKKNFSVLSNKNRVIVVLGAINSEIILRYTRTHRAPGRKKYLAVFQGRFHPQKGVVELIDIWKLVTQKIPDAKLAMIGDGPLMDNVKLKIKELHLDNNINLLGYLQDGEKKFAIFQNSKIVVHPSFYDSGGIAPGEAMAFGLPCVGFDLKSFTYYYPKGMLKVPVGNFIAFAEKIVRLNSNRGLYNKIGKEAAKIIAHSWEKRAKEVIHALKFSNHDS